MKRAKDFVQQLNAQFGQQYPLTFPYINGAGQESKKQKTSGASEGKKD